MAKSWNDIKEGISDFYWNGGNEGRARKAQEDAIADAQSKKIVQDMLNSEDPNIKRTVSKIKKDIEHSKRRAARMSPQLYNRAKRRYNRFSVKPEALKYNGITGKNATGIRRYIATASRVTPLKGMAIGLGSIALLDANNIRVQKHQLKKHGYTKKNIQQFDTKRQTKEKAATYALGSVGGGLIHRGLRNAAIYKRIHTRASIPISRKAVIGSNIGLFTAGTASLLLAHGLNKNLNAKRIDTIYQSAPGKMRALHFERSNRKERFAKKYERNQTEHLKPKMSRVQAARKAALARWAKWRGK